MATNNAINLSAAGICRYDGAGVFTGITVTQHSVLVGAASNGVTSIALTNGQMLIGNTGADPSAATITAGPGIVVTPGSGTLQISATGAGLAWTVVSGTSQAMAVNNGYTSNNAGLCTMTLPATAAVGDTIQVSGLGAGGWAIAQNALQVIHFGSATTTIGITGSLASTNAFDAIEITCVVANTTWIARNSIGNITVV